MNRPETLPGLLASIVALHPDAAALVEGDKTLSFRELEENSLALAAGLAARGIGPGARVAVWLPNRADWLVTLFALARLGAVCVSVNTRFRAAEIEDIVGRSRCSVLIYEPGFRGIDFEGILAGVDHAALSGLKLVIAARGTPAGDLPAQVQSATFASLMETPPDGACAASPDDGVIVFTTSGTTSKPKFVLHTQRSLTVHACEVAERFGYKEEGTTLLQALPYCGTFGLAQGLAAIAAARPSVLMPAFEATAAVELIRTHGVTTFNGSDEMMARICEVSEPDDLKTVQWCGFGAFANARVVEFAETCARSGLTIVGLYGMSEVQALYARQALDAPLEQRVQAGGALTSPHAGIEIRDPETGAVLPDGRTGELYLRGPSQMLEYMDNPEATNQTIGSDGFVRSGDLGHLLEDGRFVFETRMGDGIRLGGFLVNPAEIDAWLERHSSVAASQTVGVEIDRQTRPVAFVVASDGATISENALIEHCNEGLAKFKVPRRILAIDAFPVTDGPNGVKIQRGRLRELAEAQLEPS